MILARHFLISGFLVACCASLAHAQVSIPALTTAVTEDFASVGTAQTAILPAHWKMDKNASAVRTVGTYTLAVTATEQRAGNNMSSTAANGLYNYAAGDPAAATDRALGFISSSSGTKSGNLYAWYRNNSGSAIGSFTVSYNVEKYRAGSNAAGFSIQLYYSTDGMNWSPATGPFLTSFAADAANAGYASAPGVTVPVTGTIVQGIPVGGDLYLAWNYSVTSGTTTSNAQGLGVDDVSIIAIGAGGPLPTTVQFATATSSYPESAGTATVTVTITNPSPTAATTVNVALTGGTATNGIDINPAYTMQTLTWPPASSTPKTISVTIVDDAVFEGDETLIFQLQNVSGGTNASGGGQNTHTLTILENDPPPVPDVIVNEYYNATGDIATYEAVELYVYQDGLDMRGYSLVDATSGGTYPYGSLTFSNDPLWANLQAGTIIVIGGIFAVPAQDTDPSDGLLILNPPAANQTNQYFTGGSNTISIAGASDVVAIRDAGAGFVHGLAHGTANQPTLPSGRHGWNSGTAATGQTIAFSRTGGPMTVNDFLINTYTAIQAAPSLGAANDAEGNLAFLRAIRSRTITANRTLAGTFFWDVAVNGATVNMTGPVNIGNSLTVNDGSFYENGNGLSLNATGNAPNGSGLGNITVGNNAGAGAVLHYASDPGTISGAIDFDQTDATVDYRSTVTQAVLPAVYNDVNFFFGGPAAPKLLAAPATVNGTLSIMSGAMLSVVPPSIITLGPTGNFNNASRFTGSIQSTRTVATIGIGESFGGIGVTITPTAPGVPGVTTAKMTSGYYLWIGNLPSILKYYTVTAATGTGNNATMVFRYDANDLNGQTESALGLKFSSNAGASWSNLPGTLNTGAKTMTHAAGSVNGLWTMHANPPQGVIAVDQASLSFEAEQNYNLPASQPLNVSNLSANGSILEWTAVASPTTTPPWLSISPVPATGVNAGAFLVNVLRTDLAPGIYTGSIVITDPHAVNSPKVIPVTYTVHMPRRICVGADTIFVKASYKKANVRKEVAVLNCGGAFGPDVIEWQVTSMSPWLSVSPLAGTEGQAFSMLIDLTNMPPGNYYGSITLTGKLSIRGTPVANSPLTLPVTVEVETPGNVAGNTGALPIGVTRTIYNSLGQRVADVKLNSGSISSLVVRMFPDQLPEGISRLRYAVRYYLFEPTGGPYNMDITMYYTGNQAAQMFVTPADLRGWRQFPIAGIWHPTTSSSNPIMNSVTITGITDLSGAWSMATPYFPIAMPVRAMGARWIRENLAEIAWETGLKTAPGGFMLERRTAGREAWSIVGVIPWNPTGHYHHLDAADDNIGYDFRLLAIDATGTAYGSDPIPLAAGIVLDIASDIQESDLRLDTPVPNPVSLSRHASVSIRFSTPGEGDATLQLFDAYGRLVRILREEVTRAGMQTVRLGTGGLSPGTYFCRLFSNGSMLTRKLLIVQ